MGEKILKLRNEGKTYNEIKKILGCSKGTISYYCGDNQKNKTIERTKKRRKNKLLSQTERFVHRPPRKKKENLRKFQKRDNEAYKKIDKNIKETFNWLDVLDKFGEDTVCYLSGVSINLYDDNYSMDHIYPVSKGGDNSIDNLGITHRVVNNMKTDLTVDEFIEWCIKIVEYQGYEINKLK